MDSEEKPHHKALAGYDPVNMQAWMISVNLGVTAFTTLILILRIASRRIRHQRLWWDDYTILVSLAWLYGLDILGFVLFHEGVGIHIDELAPEKAVLTAKWLLVGGVLYVWNLCWTKISVLLMYYRIFDFPPFRRKAFWVAGLVIVWAFCATLLFVFLCVPTAKIWYPELPGHCNSQIATWLANGIATIVTDLIILLMPIRQIWKLRLKTSEKLGLTLIMSLGCFVMCASFYRLFVLLTYDRADSTYTLGPSITWSIIEVAVSIISACLPTLLPVLRLCTNTLGIKFRLLGSIHGGADSVALNGAPGGQGASGNGNVPQNPLVTIGQQSSRRQTGSSFLRLSDDVSGLHDEHHREDCAKAGGHSPDSILMHTLPQETKPQSTISG